MQKQTVMNINIEDFKVHSYLLCDEINKRLSGCWNLSSSLDRFLNVYGIMTKLTITIIITLKNKNNLRKIKIENGVLGAQIL